MRASVKYSEKEKRRWKDVGRRNRIKRKLEVRCVGGRGL